MARQNTVQIFMEEWAWQGILVNIPWVDSIIARTWYAVRWCLDSETQTKLEELLSARKVDTIEASNNANFSFAVATRAWTKSAESSKIGRILDDIEFPTGITVEKVTFYHSKLENTGDARLKGILKRKAHDRMTQWVYEINKARKRRWLSGMFSARSSVPVEYLDVSIDGETVLKDWCKRVGTSLNDGMIARLISVAVKEERTLTDVECFAFAQANSEHCRHQTFNARWIIDGVGQEWSLMDMIKATYTANPDRVVSAYSDNTAVFRREHDELMDYLETNPETRQFYFNKVEIYLTAKVETHNHPTAISPKPGAATGVGWEIRDEWATGRGAKTGQGGGGFWVSDLTGDPYNVGQNPWLATPLEIMTDGPLGAAWFDDEFGRPKGNGTFTVYSAETADGRLLGLPKPMMAAWGIGKVKKIHAFKPTERLPVWTHLVQIGGPNFRIGLGGASGSSWVISGKNTDYSSVQRGDPEMQRRCQNVINRFTEMQENKILAIHDVGAWGIGNAFAELGEMGKQWAEFWLDKALIGDPSLSQREIWSNESQERYVLAISEEDYPLLAQICEEEWIPQAWMGIITEWDRFHVTNNGVDMINMSFDDFFYKESPVINATTNPDRWIKALDIVSNVRDAVMKTIGHPTVASKRFLVTIADQTVGGLTTKSQMEGPWWVPVGDVAVQLDGFHETTGNAMVSAEAMSIAPIDPAASVRMAITEALTNMLAADVSDIKNIIFSGNWMANLKDAVQFVDLHTAVKAASEFMIELWICIPTGKDSLSMQVSWENKLKWLRKKVKVGAPVIWYFTAFSPVADASRNMSTYIQPREGTELLFIDMANGEQRLGGSILAQIHKQIGNECPDMDAQTIKNLYKAIIQLKREWKILAYHDRSTGWLITTLSEMAFTSHCGLDIDISSIASNSSESAVNQALLNQEWGVVIQISSADKEEILRVLRENHLWAYTIAKPRFVDNPDVIVRHGTTEVFSEKTANLHKRWSAVSDMIRLQRENPETVKSELEVTHDYSRKAIQYHATCDIENHPAKAIIANYNKTGAGPKPKIAILRAPWINGENEMANKFMMAGFDAYNISMDDLRSWRANLRDFQGLAPCGGFSYGDVLGAWVGWAKSILLNEKLRQQFSDFFAREGTFSFGVCNGAQMMMGLKDIIPGAQNFPNLKKNTSAIFESRSVDVMIPEDTNAVALNGMWGSRLPIIVSHGEWRAEWENMTQGSMLYVDHTGTPTEVYPYNPNGSPGGSAAFVNEDGRHFALMPHPERSEEGNPLDAIFYNLRVYAEDHPMVQWAAWNDWKYKLQEAA